MSSETVRMVNGVPIQTVQWKEEGNWTSKFKVFAIQFPQIRATKSGKCGIVHASV